MRQYRDALIDEMAVAEPAVILPTGVDHQYHRPAAHGTNRGLNFLRHLFRTAAIDHYYTRLRDDDPGGGVHALVGCRSRPRFADEGIDAPGDFQRHGLPGLGRGGKKNQQHDKCAADGGHGVRSLLTIFSVPDQGARYGCG